MTAHIAISEEPQMGFLRFVLVTSATAQANTVYLATDTGAEEVSAREDVRIPNQATIEAMEEARRGNLPRFSTVAELMADLDEDD